MLGRIEEVVGELGQMSQEMATTEQSIPASCSAGESGWWSGKLLWQLWLPWPGRRGFGRGPRYVGHNGGHDGRWQCVCAPGLRSSPFIEGQGRAVGNKVGVKESLPIGHLGRCWALGGQ
jgi:hypothetical protein